MSPFNPQTFSFSSADLQHTYISHCMSHPHTHTHTHTLRQITDLQCLRGRGEFIFCLFPSWTVPPPGPPRCSGQLVSAQGPSQVNCLSLVRDGHVFCYFACFFCWSP